MIKAVIFDMDGLMVDSEPLHSKAYEAVLREYGHDPKFNEYGLVYLPGVSARNTWSNLKEQYKIEEDIEILTKKKREVYVDLLKKNLKPMPGLIDLVKALRQEDIKIAVASGSSLKHIEIILEGLGIKEYFDLTISGEFLEKGKPHPEIYLTTAKELKIDPEYCIALEDAAVGVESALAAGMKVIVVPNAVTKKQDFSKATLVVKSLEDLNWGVISKL